MREYLRVWLFKALWDFLSLDGIVAAINIQKTAVSDAIGVVDKYAVDSARYLGNRLDALEGQTSIVSQLQKELEEVRLAQREIQDFRREVVEKSKVVRTRNSSEFRKLVEG